ncbi:MAG: anaerobic ribonucleoside-triphosphate reductase activating protein [Vallitaleaceae bacterium]|nr:anaerobic ribonucleoside-triphosphate reductase activating protein [Vallitaleaceae bacterium]
MIHGYTKTTLLDYPGHIASTLFLGGCNFLCPFCHNSSLVSVNNSIPTLDDHLIFDDIKKRKHLIEGVVLTGGEPSLASDLISLVTQIKELGLKVKLDTNGSNPKVLERLLDLQLLDYVAMDIKASKENYSRTCGLHHNTADRLLDHIETSIHLLKHNSYLEDYEFRTTVIQEFHDLHDLEKIANWILPAKHWFLQCYEYNPNQLNLEVYHPIEKEPLEQFIATLGISAKIQLRGY